eukprot:CAMPEP_0185293846 /NCGR_PEP_ID=MMETSP1363-20130426/7182_1 /TAXON_ID=38817 /ORGANISM="Gephyrocapsa oceanica, Strain RCC1303" /LENGTH=56 /DNA_ID=CAMNT_0027890253 /DNA_START=15 /DNA_END=182 /DNA_ORIENTATION=-
MTSTARKGEQRGHPRGKRAGDPSTCLASAAHHSSRLAPSPHGPRRQAGPLPDLVLG